jgi:2-haloalkanoic acid dehalogenase type II
MFDAVIFDLLSALIDSWSLWDDVAGGEGPGRRWRLRYLEITYATGTYRPYEDLVAESATDEGLGADAAAHLVDRWAELDPWPEAPAVLRRLGDTHRLGVVTNCSVTLGRAAARSLDVSFDAVMTAEEAGAYKPLAAPYERTLDALGTSADRTLFVAGSPGDIGGASAVGMTVVWHNRLGLDLPRGSPEPWRTILTLDRLVDLIGS